MNKKQQKNPETVEEVFRDFKGRRAGIIKALTSDFEAFYHKCDPKMQNLCLYGFPDEQWQTDLAPSPPSELPQPKSGINLLRDKMKKLDWLSMVALHSDAWLYALASYFGAICGLDSANRKLLFSMICDLPTVHEVVIGERIAKPKAKRLRLAKKMAAEEDPFPVELWTEILSRIPVKSLLKFRCICRLWCSMIDDPDFVFKHLSASKDDFEAYHWIIQERPHVVDKKERFFLHCVDTFRKIRELDFFIKHKEFCDVVGCINGVVLIHKKHYISESIVDSMAILWNPSIRKSLKIPPFPFSTICSGRMERFKPSKIGFGTDILLKNDMFLELGFGFDVSDCDLKVVAIFYPSVHKAISFSIIRMLPLEYYVAVNHGLVAIYSLKTGIWRSIDVHPPCLWCGGPQAFVNKAIHWIGVRKRDLESPVNDAGSFIVAFDLCNEVFHYIDLPDEGSDCRRKIVPLVVVLDDSVALFDSFQDNTCIVWVMEEYGVPGSWTERYKFELEFDPFLYLKGGALLFAVNRKGVKLYDIERMVIKDLARTFHKSFDYKVFTYRESLLLSDAENGER